MTKADDEYRRLKGIYRSSIEEWKREHPNWREIEAREEQQRVHDRAVLHSKARALMARLPPPEEFLEHQVWRFPKSLLHGWNGYKSHRGWRYGEEDYMKRVGLGVVVKILTPDCTLEDIIYWEQDDPFAKSVNVFEFRGDVLDRQNSPILRAIEKRYL